MNNKEIKLEKLAKKYERILKEELNIPISNNIEYKINTRASQRYGACKEISYNFFRIEISDFLLEDNVKEDILVNTIIHELLHTVDGCMDHKEKWKNYANIVNNKLGYNIKRVTSRKELGLEEYISKEKVKYIFQCENCGQIVNIKRKCNFVNYYEQYRCVKCKGKFKRIQ